MKADHEFVIRAAARQGSRAWVLSALAIACLAFAAYGSLVPLRLRAVPIDIAVERFLATPFVPLDRASKTDLISNVALFFPVGFFLTGALAGPSRARAVAWLPGVLAFAVASSVLIEFSQVFASGRTPSWNDVLAESLGAVVGGAAWTLVGPFVSTWVAALAQPQTGRDLAVRLLGIYAALWALLAILPLDFTIRPAEIAAKLRRGRVVFVPFTGAANVAEGVQDAVGTLLMAVPVGALVALVLGRAAGPAIAVLLGVAAIAGVELVQVFVASRTVDVTDVLTGGLGVLAGVLVARRWATPEGTATIRSGVGARLGALGLLLFWCVIVIVRHWSPFEFTRDATVVAERIRNLPWVPFQSYYWARPLDSLAEATMKILLGLPVGVLLQYAWASPHTTLARLTQAGILVALGAAFFALVEAGQVLLPARFPDPTDVVLGTIGVGVGLLIVRRFDR